MAYFFATQCTILCVVCRSGGRQSCWKRRTALEKLLTVILTLTACLLAVAALIAVILAAGIQHVAGKISTSYILSQLTTCPSSMQNLA